MKKLIFFCYVMIEFFGKPSPIHAQINISEQLDIVFRNPSGKDYSNKTFVGFSNFDVLKLRLFFDAVLGENKTVFTQIVFNNNRIIPYAAYIKFSNIFDRNINLNVGLIPNTIGTYGPRTYADKNPLIGTPLVYNYHTSLSLGKSLNSLESLNNLKGKGYMNYGLLILYDFCWNTGIEIYGNKGNMDWSVGALSGSVTAPTLSIKKDLSQMTARLGLYITPELSIHLSGFMGPYISQYPERENPIDVNDYFNTGGGFSLHYTGSYLDIHSEIFGTKWEPNPIMKI